MTFVGPVEDPFQGLLLEYQDLPSLGSREVYSTLHGHFAYTGSLLSETAVYRNGVLLSAPTSTRVANGSPSTQIIERPPSIGVGAVNRSRFERVDGTSGSYRLPPNVADEATLYPFTSGANRPWIDEKNSYVTSFGDWQVTGPSDTRPIRWLAESELALHPLSIAAPGPVPFTPDYRSLLSHELVVEVSGAVRPDACSIWELGFGTAFRNLPNGTQVSATFGSNFFLRNGVWTARFTGYIAEVAISGGDLDIRMPQQAAWPSVTVRRRSLYRAAPVGISVNPSYAIGSSPLSQDALMYAQGEPPFTVTEVDYGSDPGPPPLVLTPNSFTSDADVFIARSLTMSVARAKVGGIRSKGLRVTDFYGRTAEISVGLEIEYIAPPPVLRAGRAGKGRYFKQPR